jgi:hypothetical protein
LGGITYLKKTGKTKSMEIDKSVFRFPFIGKEGFELVLLCSAAFLAPMLVTQQIALGTIVNATLVLSALRISGAKAYLPAFIPSVVAMLLGIVLGQPSGAVAAMLPFIWLGNAMLMFVVRKIRDKYWKALVTGAMSKTALLFASSFALVYFVGLPAKMLAAFGIIQFATAMLGGTLAYAALKTRI